MKSGIIKLYFKDKGYGFITPDSSKKNVLDIFFHHSALRGSKGKRTSIQQGDRVEFETEFDEIRKKERAIDVHLVLATKIP